MTAECGQIVDDDAGQDEPQKESCWFRFTKWIRALWATQQTEDTKTNRELYITTTIRELVIYLVFVCILMIVTFGMTSSTSYFYKKALSNLLEPNKDLDNVATIGDMWDYLGNKFIPALFNSNKSPRKASNRVRQNWQIYFENLVLGVVRMRQVRVKNQSCLLPPNFRQRISRCFAGFSSGAEDKEPIQNGFSQPGWIYKHDWETEALSYSYKVATYSGGGFVVDLNWVEKETTDKLARLRKDNWIRSGSRALFVDFTVYNGNVNLFCVVKLIFELPPSGGVLAQQELRIVKLLRYVTGWDYFIGACECVFVLFLIYYCVEEVIEIRKHHLAYFHYFWNLLDVVVLGISWVCVFFSIYRNVKVAENLDGLLQQTTTFPAFDFLSYWQGRFDQAVAVNLFLCWIKIFKYISFNKTMTQLSSTLARCAKDLFGFAIMFFIIFFAFAQLGYLLFGSQAPDFHELQHSVFTLFRIVLGDFDFNQLSAAHAILGPLFFLLYVFFVFFILINMFLAIINETYCQVKSEMALQRDEVHMADYIKQKANAVLEKMHQRRDKIVEIQAAIKKCDLNEDNEVSFDEWRDYFKSQGYADAEIEAVFSKYDLDGDRILNYDEQKRMHLDLEGEKAELNEQICKEHDQLVIEPHAAVPVVDNVYPDMIELQHRVTMVQGKVTDLLRRLDWVLAKMQSLEVANSHNAMHFSSSAGLILSSSGSLGANMISMSGSNLRDAASSTNMWVNCGQSNSQGN